MKPDVNYYLFKTFEKLVVNWISIVLEDIKREDWYFTLFPNVTIDTAAINENMAKIFEELTFHLQLVVKL